MLVMLMMKVLIILLVVMWKLLQIVMLIVVNVAVKKMLLMSKVLIMEVIMKCNLNMLMSKLVLLVVNPAGVIWRKAKSRWTRNLLPAGGPCLSSPLIVGIVWVAVFLAKPLPPSPSRGAKKAPIVKCCLVGTVLFFLPLLSRLLVPAVVGPLVYLVGTRCLPLWLLCPRSSWEMMSFLCFIFASLSIISININDLRGLDKPSGLSQWLRSLPCTVDVVCIQEAHCTSVFECDSWFRWSGFLSSVSPRETRETVAACRRALLCHAGR